MACGDGCCSGHHDDEPMTTPRQVVAATTEQGCCEDDCCGCDDETTQGGGSSSTATGYYEEDHEDEEPCDEKCILAAAAFECNQACGDGPNGTTSSRPSTACSSHRAQALKRYSAYLKSARCICDSVLDHGRAKTCCGGHDHDHDHDHDDEADRVVKIAGQEADETKYHPSSRVLPGHDGRHHHHSYGAVKKRGHNHNHSHSHNHNHNHNHNHQHRQLRNSASITTSSTFPSSSCCSSSSTVDEKKNMHIPFFKTNNDDEDEDDEDDQYRDLEKGQTLEHVTLSVDGMTCSGCGAKMERVLKAMTGLSTVRVNFVMGSVDFDMDTSRTSLERVMRAAERASGFHCTKMSAEDQTVDLLSQGSSAKALVDNSSLVPGVKEAAALNKKVVRLTYDPAVVGARTLMRDVGPYTTGLAPPIDDPGLSSGRRRLRDRLIKTIVSACFTIPVLALAWSEKKLVDARTEGIISLVLATVVQLIAVPDFYIPAIGALIHSRSLEMDMLVVISITAAYSYSVIAFAFFLADKPLAVGPLFETSTLLVTLVLLGRLVAAFARLRAVAAVSLRSLQATTAVIVEADGKDREIDSRLLQYGDKVKIGPHVTIPTDATVIGGLSEVDESIITGESLPVTKKPGDNVIAGTANGSGILTTRLKRLPGKNTVTDIARLVEEAAASRPKIQETADRVASWFVPVVSGIAVVVVVAWIVVGLRVHRWGAGEAVANAMTYAVATLAVSCPCALGLAVPMVLVVAGGIAARNGVIIKSAGCTERSRSVTDVVLDKTGTITEPGLDVINEQVLTSSGDYDETVAVAKALVADSRHPVSLAVAKHLADNNPEVKPAAGLSDVRAIPGSGVQAVFQGKAIRAGNATWTETSTHPAVVRLLERGLSILVVTSGAEPVAVFGMRCRLRSEAKAVISKLQRQKIAVHIVSGDHGSAVESVAAQVGVSLVASRCSPSDKRDYVAELMGRGRCVMFVGDGTNDAIAVAQADVGVQLASVESCSEVTRSAADVVLLNGLEGIRFLMRISAVGFRRIVFNFVWSAAYNVLAVLLASGVLNGVRIPPAYAGLGEIVSVLPVILAAMTMLWKKV
ncbi:hypothetical protein CP532_5472 [Ophiocordyceps camponoti-leonardi (nom. inval.)]|nr:hypothetical protein CP532_5472 [Ophiocordyceps camponoti-leonardi (nom. inval.)]